MNAFFNRLKWLLFGGDQPIEHNYRTAVRGPILRKVDQKIIIHGAARLGD